MTTPAVSVVVPCYNHPRFLPGAVQSALSQTLSDIEIVLVDDGSPHDIQAIVAPFVPSGRLRCVRQDNRGVAAARNTGRALAAAPYIAFLDEDDAWTPDKLERQLAVLEAHPDVALVFTDGYRIYQDDSPAKIPRFQDFKKLRERASWIRAGDVAVLQAGSLPLQELMHGIMLTTSVMMRASAFDAAGGFDERVRNGEDIDFFFRVHRKYPVAYLDRQLFRYRLTDGSLSRGGAATLRSAHGLAAHMSNYPLSPPERAGLQRHMGELEWDLAYNALIDGQPAEARQWLARAFGKAPRADLGTLSLVGASMMPGAVFRNLRRLRDKLRAKARA